MTLPRRMFEVGVEGDRFNQHAECPTCPEQGCVPVHSDPPTCDVCQRQVKRISSKALLGCADMLCADCWHAWYDEGHRTRESLRAAVLTKHGPYGGEANLTEPLLAWYAQHTDAGRLRDAAQAVVEAYRGVKSGLGFDTSLTRLSDAVQSLETVLREGEEKP